MKKKVVIIIGAIILVLVGCFIAYNNIYKYVITLDVNPSMELGVNRHMRVVKVKALNDEAKTICDGLRHQKLDKALEKIADRLYKDGYVFEDTIEVLIYTNDSELGRNTTDILNNSFSKINVASHINVAENVTEEDLKIAKREGVTPAKAAFINSVLKEILGVKFADIKDKAIIELSEMKRTGNYCDSGYTLDGNFCVKESKTVLAITGKVCPMGYHQYNDVCYESVNPIPLEELECNTGFEFNQEGKCVGKREGEVIANFTCDKGTLIERGMARNRYFRDAGDPNEYVCEDTSTASYPTERCYLQEHVIINGVCAVGPKPLLPTPTGCEGDDINYNGGCYDPTPSEPYVCPDGDRRDDNKELCYDTFTYTIASGSYSCHSGYTLDGRKCFTDAIEEAHNKLECPSGYTKVDGDRCINLDKTTEFVDGYVCDTKDARIDGNKCILYEVVPAKHD